MSDAKHTPAPWSWRKADRRETTWFIEGGEPKWYIAETAQEANADLIVRAVNSYEPHRRCVEALRALTREFSATTIEYLGDDPHEWETYSEARAALAALEETE